jgi:hypothetical protein
MTMGRQGVTTVKPMLISVRPSTLPAAWAPVTAVRPRSASLVAHALAVGCPAVRSLKAGPTPFSQVESVRAELGTALIAGTYSSSTNVIQNGFDVRGVPPRGRPV